MSLTWLHLSDLHFKATESFDHKEVSRELVESVARFCRMGKTPDVIFATGDIAFSGKASEYERATEFFDALLKAAGLGRQHLFVIPGNHDVDRDLCTGLVRTLSSLDEADAYFSPDGTHAHLTSKLKAYREWYDRFFEGIRRHPRDSSCGPVEAVEAGGVRLGILPSNSALFCQDDYDHEKLFVGRRCLSDALAQLGSLNADLNVALIHHPVGWLSSVERSQIRSRIQSRFDFVLSGHLHETNVERVETAEGQVLYLAAGAFYEKRDKRIECGQYVRLEGGYAEIFPIRYSERPHPSWALDTGIFPNEPSGVKKFPIGRDLLSSPPRSEFQPSPRPKMAGGRLNGIRSNITRLDNQLFVGREDSILEIASVFAVPSRGSQLVVRGIPGVGKSELAREYARRKRDRYPGGTFIIDFSTGLPVDLARVGEEILNLNFRQNSRLVVRCQKALHELFANPSLLIYDNVLNERDLRDWLPPAGVACHILATTVMDSGFGDWYESLVEPLSEDESWEFVKRLGGPVVSNRYGKILVEAAGGLPIQLVPAIKRVAHEVKRDRTASITFALGAETLGSFEGTLKRLRPEALRFLQAAAFFVPRKVPRGEVEDHLQTAFEYSPLVLQIAVDECQDFSLLKGNDLLQMNPLLASYVSGVPFEGGEEAFAVLCCSRAKRFGELARQVSTFPPDVARSTNFLSYPLDFPSWKPIPSQEMVDAVAAALLKIELFEDAYRWYGLGIETFLEAHVTSITKRERDALLGLSDRRHQMGFCLSRLGRFDDAAGQLQGAVDAVRLIPVMTPRAFDGLARSLTELGRCFLQGGNLERSRETFDAVLAQEIVDHIERNRLAWLKSEIGQWYRGAGEISLAKDWLERAIEDSRQVRPADHDQIGYIYHQLGLCYTSSKKEEEAQMARDFFERAVAEVGKGDRAGQVNFQHLSISLHQLGCCLVSLKRSDEAIEFFFRAMSAAEKGDSDGQVNRTQLGEIRYMMGQAYLETSRDAREALRWFQESVEAKRQGNLLGRVDRESLRLSLEAAGRCHRKLGEEGEALRLDAEAVALTTPGAV